jgi:hypothetical protein
MTTLFQPLRALPRHGVHCRAAGINAALAGGHRRTLPFAQRCQCPSAQPEKSGAVDEP